MIVPRKYQLKAHAAAMDYMRNNPGKHPVIGMPTGSGKTINIGLAIEEAYKWHVPTTILSHNKEILEQDYNSVKNYLKQVNFPGTMGLYSAGLSSRTIGDVTIAGIQSVYKKPEQFAHSGLIIIDEAHMINNKNGSMYSKFFDGLNNPRYLGFTATAFRLGTGYIYGPDQLFDAMPFDITSGAQFVKLIEDGYLSQIVTKQTQVELDTNGVRTIAGDFSEKDMSLKFDRTSITNAAIDEILLKAEDRKSWLIFAIDIKHAEHIAERLISKGISTNVVHSKMEFDRDTVISDFKNGRYRCIVNVNVLTTGFDHPAIDLIVALRPTKSPVFHVQTAGRGLRVAYTYANENSDPHGNDLNTRQGRLDAISMSGKEDCLFLDFAGNTARLGPINNILVKKKKKMKGGEPITKVCPVCDSIVAPAVRICPDCGHKFVFKVNIDSSSGSEDVVQMNTSQWYDVVTISYSKHSTGRSPDSIKVTYTCGLKTFSEWVCVNHVKWAKHQANHFLRYREGIEPVEGILNDLDAILKISDTLKVPKRILINKKKKYPEVVDYLF